MSGPSKQPHNAGQTVIVQQISPMPVSDMDWGPITITENWGRLFIRWNGQEVIALMGHYPKLVEAIQHFIEPAASTPDPAQIRADALREAAALMEVAATNCRAAFTYPPRTKEERDYQTAALVHTYARDAILALLDTPLSPTAVDGSQAPDAGGKEPCNECFLPANETCDICGAVGPSGKAGGKDGV